MQKIALTKSGLTQLLLDFLAAKEGQVKGFVDSVFDGKPETENVPIEKVDDDGIICSLCGRKYEGKEAEYCNEHLICRPCDNAERKDFP